MLVTLPEFTAEGHLPAGIHEMQWSEFKDKFGYNYCRNALIQGMLAALDNLKKAGCSTVYIDGSFVTNKRYPNDYDGCWDPTGVDVSLLDPVLLDFSDDCIAQKVKFSGELYPATIPSISYNTMLDFFQEDRDGNPKGIVKIDLGGINDQE